MNKWIAITLCLFSMNSSSVRTQSDEALQLLLNWEKLAQFKKILSNMYDGYKILNTG